MAGRGRIKLSDIASAANVSVTTVSNVVNGRLDTMSEQTRARVETAIRDLNYRPDEGARNLRLSQRGAIGLIVVDDSPRFLADPMTCNIVAGLSNCLSAQGYGLLMSGIRNAAMGDAHLIRRDQTDGLCIIPSGSAEQRRALFHVLRATGQPVVVIQDLAPAFMSDTLSVRQDDRKAGALIARRVVERGARRLALLLPSQDWPAMAERQRGIEAVLAGRAIDLATVLCGGEGVRETQAAISRHVDRQGLPDVFIGGNDQMGIAALTWAQDRNLSVPADVKVIGFNGFDFADYVRPRLTTVTSPAYDMGRQSAAALLSRLAEGHFGTPSILFDVALAPGHSD